MKSFAKKMIGTHVKGAMGIMDIVVDVALVSALIPVIVGFINSAEGNLSAAEFTLYGLTTLFIIVGLLYQIMKQSGFGKKR